MYVICVCLVRVYLQLFVGVLVSYVCYNENKQSKTHTTIINTNNMTRALLQTTGGKHQVIRGRILLVKAVLTIPECLSLPPFFSEAQYSVPCPLDIVLSLNL
jgi:hypothetical protein